MKKVLFTVALAFGAMTISAQQSVVKEAKKIKDPVQASQVIEAALTNPETANDPETWKLAGDLQKAIYDQENEKMYLSAVDPSKVADTAKLYNSLMKLYEYYYKCDELEMAKVASGELKKAKLRKKNAETLKKLRQNLLLGGQDTYNAGKYDLATKFFGLYVDAAESPLFSEDIEVKGDTSVTYYASYAALAANMNNDQENVIKYGNIGKNDKEVGYNALMSLADSYAKTDSVKWLETLKEGTEKFPTREWFVGHLMDYYQKHNMIDQAMTEIDRLIAVADLQYYYYVKALFLFEKSKYDESIAVCDQMLAKGGNLDAEAYSKKGDCYFWQGQDIEQKNAELALEDPQYKTNDAKIKELYQLAEPMYLKAKELKPETRQLWTNLLTIYWKLNKEEYDKLEKEIGY